MCFNPGIIFLASGEDEGSLRGPKCKPEDGESSSRKKKKYKITNINLCAKVNIYLG